MEAPGQGGQDWDDEDFGLSSHHERAQPAAEEHRALSERAESVDLYGDVAADAEGDDYAAIYGQAQSSKGPAEDRAASHAAANTTETEGPQQDGGPPSTSQQRSPGAGTAPPPPQQQQQQQRPPQQPAVYSNSSAVYIGNLQWWTTDAEIEALCARFGAIERLRFFEEKPTGKSKGYVLVVFNSAKVAFDCKEGVDGMEINGKKCVVTFAKDQGAGRGQRADGAAGASTSQGPVGRAGPFRGGRGQDFGGRGGGRGMGDAAAASTPFTAQQQGPGRPSMGWGPRPGMVGPYMPPGMGPMMGGPPMPGMPFMPPGYAPGMGMGGMPYGPNMMNGYGEPGFKRPRY